MQILRCDQSHEAQWNAFVHASPRASFYHRWEWRGINDRAFGHKTAYLAALESGRFVGVFPMVRLKSLLFGNMACSMPFVNYGGPAAETDAVEQRLLDSAAQVADEWRVDYLEIRSQHRLDERYPCSDCKVSMTIALDPDPEAVMGRFKREQRADIRRAYKNGFTTRFGPELIDDFYTVLSESWRDLGTPDLPCRLPEKHPRRVSDRHPRLRGLRRSGQSGRGRVHRASMKVPSKACGSAFGPSTGGSSSATCSIGN